MAILTKAKPEESVQTSNYVKMVGSVIAKDIISSELIRLKIAVSSTHEESKYCILPICFYGEDAVAQIDQAIRCEGKEKARVEVIGFVQTSKRVRTAADGSTVAEYYQDIVGTSIAFAKNALESVFALQGLGKTKAPSMNQFVCFGKVVNTFLLGADENRKHYLTVKTWHNGHANFPQFVCQGARTGQVARTIHNNDYVVAVGELLPRRTTSQGKTIIKTQLVVTDLQRISENAIQHLKEVAPILTSDDIIFQKNV